MRFSSSWATLIMILVHFSLSISSMIFRIPLRRIAGGYRIWPEYRLHSIVFACRSLATMLLTWVEMRYGLEPMYSMNIVIVLATCISADLGSASVGPPGSSGRSSTIRDLEAGPATHFFFSAMQFHATAGCLLGIRRFSNQFVYVWIVQFNAFLMTVRRKNLAPQELLVTIYGLMLIFGLLVASYEHHRVGMLFVVNTLGNVAGLLRIGLGVPKYAMWMIMALLTQFARSTVEQGTPLAVIWPYTWLVSFVTLIGLGLHKIMSKRKQESKAEPEKTTGEKIEAKSSETAKLPSEKMMMMMAG